MADSHGYGDHLARIGLDATALALDSKGTLAVSATRLAQAGVPSQLPDLGMGGELALGAVLGEGGMGVVRSARQESIGREVAVKVVRGGGPAEQALIREGTITGRLEHPNIVPIYALGCDADGKPALVMKRIEGRSWIDQLDQDAARLPHEPERLGYHLGVLMAVCRAVSFAHARGILHRDLKPDNVMLGEFGEVYLCDWGLAVSFGADRDPRLPHARDVDYLAGTPGYMAPEMAAVAASQLGPATDVYLLGAVLHRIVVGRPLHDADSLPAALAQAFASEPFAYPDDIPAELADICRKATRRAAEQRFAGAEELRAAVASFLEHAHGRALCAAGEQCARKLAELVKATDYDPGVAYRLLTEAEFAFTQALAISPADSRARHQLQRMLEAGACIELDAGNRTAAAALIARLPEKNLDLERRLGELDARLGARAKEIELLKERAAAADPRVQASGRRRVAGIFALVGLGMTVFDFATGGRAPVDYGGLIGGAALLGGVSVALLLVPRLRGFKGHELTRRFITTMLVTTVVMLVAATAFWAAHQPVAVGIASGLLIIATSTAAAAALIHPGFGLISAIDLLGFFYAALRPDRAAFAFLTSAPLSLCLMVFVWIYAARSTAGAVTDRSSGPPPASR